MYILLCQAIRLWFPMIFSVMIMIRFTPVLQWLRQLITSPSG